MQSITVKAIAAALLCAIIMLCLPACEEDRKTEVSTGVIASAIVDKLALEDMAELTDAQVARHYAVDLDLLNDQTVYIDASGSRADEVAVFEVSENEKASAVLTAINDRLSQKLRAYEDFSPAEYEKVKNAFSVQVGKDIVLVVSDNAELIAECLEN